MVIYGTANPASSNYFLNKVTALNLSLGSWIGYEETTLFPCNLFCPVIDHRPNLGCRGHQWVCAGSEVTEAGCSQISAPAVFPCASPVRAQTLHTPVYVTGLTS